LVTIVILAV